VKANRKEGFNKDMKLYLQLQVELRALEVWGSEDNIAAEFDNREKRNMQLKDKKYRKEMTDLRKQVQAQYRSTRTNHVHEFGSEEYDEDRDLYKKMCDTCGHVDEYEKL
jgi:DNA-repair protein complementing XP-A cells